MLTVPEIASTWLAAGGSPAAVVDAVAVALAESGGDPLHVGKAGQLGVFGVWPAHAPWAASPNVDLANTAINARAAVAVSRNGRNWSAWRSAWRDVPRETSVRALAHPQVGSPAAAQLWFVRSQIGAPALSIPGTDGQLGVADVGTPDNPPGVAGMGAGIEPQTLTGTPQQDVPNQWTLTQAMIEAQWPQALNKLQVMQDALGRF